MTSPISTASPFITQANRNPEYSSVGRPIETQGQQHLSATSLNTTADRVLTSLGDLGERLERYGFGRQGSSEPVAPWSGIELGAMVTTAHGAAIEGRQLGFETQADLQRNLGNTHRASDVQPEAPSRFLSLGRIVRAVGSTFDAVTGGANVLIAIHHDQRRGDPLYGETLKESIFSTAQIAAGSLAGAAAGTVASAFAFGAGAVVLPAAIGVGVGLGVSYLAGKGIDALRSYW